MRFFNLHLLAILSLLFSATMSMAKDFIIISISQDFPMTNQQKILKKNYFLNVGSQDGVREGTKLDVFRQTILEDPYRTKKSYQYKIKVGQLEVIHSEKESSIAKLHTYNSRLKDIQMEINSFMIGDKVEISLE